MKRTVKFTWAAALALAAMAVLPLAAAACCFVCNAGYCTPGPGNGWTICYDNPADEICDVSGHCHGLEPAEFRGAVVTMASLFNASPAVIDRLFGGARERHLRFRSSDPNLSTLTGAISSLAGTPASEWRLAYWHTSVSSGPVTYRANSTRDDGYRFEAAPGVTAARLSVWTARGGKSVVAAAGERMSCGDVLLVPTMVEGRSCVLALRTVTFSAADPRFAARLLDVQKAFKEQARESAGSEQLALTLQRD